MNSDEIQWRSTIPGKSINFNEVHVWRVFLDVTKIESENLLAFLSVDELARAGRYHFEEIKSDSSLHVGYCVRYLAAIWI